MFYYNIIILLFYTNFLFLYESIYAHIASFFPNILFSMAQSKMQKWGEPQKVLRNFTEDSLCWSNGVQMSEK